MTVRDIDPLLQSYIVVSRQDAPGNLLQTNRFKAIGQKSHSGDYLRPACNASGSRMPDSKRKYKASPPWMKLEVIGIEPYANQCGLVGAVIMLIIKEDTP